MRALAALGTRVSSCHQRGWDPPCVCLHPSDPYATLLVQPPSLLSPDCSLCPAVVQVNVIFPRGRKDAWNIKTPGGGRCRAQGGNVLMPFHLCCGESYSPQRILAVLGYGEGRSTRQDEKLLCSEDILVTARNKIVPLALTLSSGPTATGRRGCCAVGWARRAPFVGKMGILRLEHSNC